MPIVDAILEVNKKSRNTHPALHTDWFVGVSLNGSLITDVYIEQEQTCTTITRDHDLDAHWQGHDTSEGVDRYFGVAVAFDSFEDAEKAFSTHHQWEIERGVFLFLSGMTAEPAVEQKRIVL